MRYQRPLLNNSQLCFIFSSSGEDILKYIVLTLIQKSAIVYFNIFAGVAQLVEQLTCNEKVEGSIPFSGTKFFSD